MALLSSLLVQKYTGAPLSETNLETGKIWVYSEFNSSGTKYPNGFCWKSPGTGTAIIEVWGPGGSGGKMCCCGIAVPGNSGSYSKKTISVTSACYVCGIIGIACGSPDVINFRGCSESTGLCWFGSGTNGCICAQGGKGSYAICSSGSAPYCCFLAAGFCNTKTLNESCGIVCNSCAGSWMACAYGGDLNCCGGVNCISFFGCYPSCPCCYQQHIRIPPGFISDNGTVVTFQSEEQTHAQPWSGGGLYNLIAGINAAGKQPSQGHTHSMCWASHVPCGCYQSTGCMPLLPVGVGAPASQPCSSVTDYGFRGGPGAVRIRFV